MSFNHAVMWYCLSVIKYIDGVSKEEIRKIGFEIAQKGRSGFDMDNPEKQYFISSLNKNLSGLQAVSWMYVTWQQIEPSMDIKMDFKNEYDTALNLFKEEQKNYQNEDEDTGYKTYLLPFKEVGINEDMSEAEMLLMAIKYLGLKQTNAISLIPKIKERMVIVRTIQFPDIMTEKDHDFFDLALSEAKTGDVNSALQKFLKLEKKYKNQPNVIENIGRCYLEMEDFHKAIEFYKRAKKLNNTAFINIGLGNSYSRLNKRTQAIKYYEKAIDLDPEYALAYNNLAATLSEIERHDEAEHFFKKALELDKKNPQTYYGLGLLYSKTGKKNDSKQYLLEAKKRVSNNKPLEQFINKELNKLNKQPKKQSREKPFDNSDLKKIIKIAEEISGKSFKYQIRDDIQHYAGIKIARKDDDHHLIYYKPENKDILYHLVAHECGHLIRTYEANEEDRVVPATNKETMDIAFREIFNDVENLVEQYGEQKTASILKMFYDGIIHQLTNYPADIMIEKWIYDKFPNLREQQFKSIKKQSDDSLASLKSEMSVFPEKIRFCTNVMNYAYFRIIGYHIKHNFIKPYSNTQYLKPGKKLAKITDERDDDSFKGDIVMTNKWADFFGIKDWFIWVDFESHK